MYIQGMQKRRQRLDEELEYEMEGVRPRKLGERQWKKTVKHVD